MAEKILITPKSYGAYKGKAHPLIEAAGYTIIENTTGRTLTADEITELSKDDVVGIIVGVDPINADVFSACKKLKAISKYGVGTDNIDLEKAKELGIKVRIAAGANTVSVAELAITLMMNISRNICVSASSVKSGGWGRAIGRELTGKKLGLIGGGQIGKEVAKRAKGLMMQVLIYDPYFTDEDFLNMYGIDFTKDINDIFKQSDYISLHVPATDETRGMINKETLSIMKNSAYIVNTSRGELINETDLYEALTNGLIAGCAEDVFSSEPPKQEVGDCRLLQLDNFILTSHIGAFTHEGVEKMVMISTQNMLDMLKEG